MASKKNAALGFILVTFLIDVIGFGIIGIFLMVQASNTQAHKRRMSIISGHGTLRNDVSDKDVKGKRLADLARKLKDSKAEEQQKAKAAKKQTIRDMLIFAGLSVPVSYFWIGSAIGGVVVLGLFVLMGMSKIVLILGFAIGFFGVPRLVLRNMAKRRQKKFLEEFADGLESMVRLLKAGMPVGEAILMISREFTGPLGEEMGRVYESQRIGVPLSESILDCARRMPLPEVQMFATGIIIQQQTGSSLSDVLTNLASLIRARFRLRRKVHALSAEAKASAAIIGALPVFVAGGLYFINPDYIGMLFTTSSGKFYLTIAVCWMMVGIVVMKQMINFKV